MTKEEVRAALARGETIDIGRVLAGTTLTKAMLDDMMLATLRGEAIHTYFDGNSVRMERIEIREIFNEEMGKISGASAQNGHDSAADTTDNDRQAPLAETPKPA